MRIFAAIYKCIRENPPELLSNMHPWFILREWQCNKQLYFTFILIVSFLITTDRPKYSCCISVAPFDVRVNYPVIVLLTNDGDLTSMDCHLVIYRHSIHLLYTQTVMYVWIKGSKPHKRWPLNSGYCLLLMVSPFLFISTGILLHLYQNFHHSYSCLSGHISSVPKCLIYQEMLHCIL